jgi:hypothetical protein
MCTGLLSAKPISVSPITIAISQVHSVPRACPKGVLNPIPNHLNGEGFEIGFEKAGLALKDLRAHLAG